MSAPLVEHYFRHEYGRLVARLTRKVGARHVELVEDAVQTALATALDAWLREVPDDPGAWLYRVARNCVIGGLRKDARRTQLLAETPEIEEVATSNAVFANEVRDDLLRMLFLCCDDAIPRESRIVLALKTLCGFSTAEIALRLFTSEANVHKRLQRARTVLRSHAPELPAPSFDALVPRLGSVQEILYLLFNEGYLSIKADAAIRGELCEEAIRLTTLLADHPAGATPSTCALLALMHLHAARLDARTDGAGGLLLLEEQDRGRWDRRHVEIGAAWLARSAEGEALSRYHAEAGIAVEHCLAPSFRETRWHEIAELYALLERIAPSPLHTLNRAVAVAEAAGVEPALAILDALVPPAWLARSYLWDAVRADLHRRAGQLDAFQHHRRRALRAAPSEPIRALLQRGLGGD